MLNLRGTEQEEQAVVARESEPVQLDQFDYKQRVQEQALRQDLRGT